MKSKTRATAIVISTNSMEAVTSVLSSKAMAGSACRELCALQQDGFEYVGSVFGLVSRRFKDFVELLQLDEIDGVLFFFKQFGDGLARDLVGKILQTVDLDTVGHDVAAFFQQLHAFRKGIPLLHHQSCEFRSRLRWMRDLIDHQALSGRVNKVQYVIQRTGQSMDIFAVKRSNKGLIELGKDGVRHVIALVLKIVQLLYSRFHVLVLA